MKNFRKTRVINRFSAVSTSFRAEFARRSLPSRRLNLTLSTVMSGRTEQAETNWLESLLEIWHQGAMVFDHSDKVLQTTEFTETMVGKYFPNSELDGNGIPVELANWMKLYRFGGSKEGIVMTNEPFVIESDEGELRIRLIVDSRVNRKTLLLRETIEVKPEHLMEPLGVTKREAEVLFLITKGKTNPEIGTLLDISTRTVQKHVEHIYIKLGVETRTAAMLRVNELNSGMGSIDAADFSFSEIG